MSRNSPQVEADDSRVEVASPKRQINPFSLPAEEDIFKLRDDENVARREKREKAKRQHVTEKTTVSSRVGQSTQKKEDLIQDGSVVSGKLGTLSRTGQALMGASTVAGSQSSPTAGDHGTARREKENMSEFLAKKREMFLVQMALDTKREEIRKLEEKAQQKEEALRKSEQMLEEDALRFDSFLKENDKKAHEAIKRAEKETKAKNEKVQEIKKLNQQIQVVQSEMSKLKEQLEDCLKHKKFLDDLTPGEYFEQCKQEKKKRQFARLEKRKAGRMKQWEEACDRAVVEHEAKERAEKARLEKEGRVKKKTDKSALSQAQLPSKPNLDDMELTSSGDEYPMYFREPTQLLDIFTALEESNLFLIQNSQETEQALEKLKQDFQETQTKMNKKTHALQQQISELTQQIAVESSKATTLKQKSTAGTEQDPHAKLLHELHDKVTEVYKKCGFDADSNPSTLFMLTDLESRLEELLTSISKMPEDYVLKAEKEKEKERRERVRQERLEQQKKMYEERMKKNIERSMQAPKKKQGRRIMFRSAPQHQSSMDEEKDEDAEKDDADAKYLT